MEKDQHTLAPIISLPVQAQPGTPDPIRPGGPCPNCGKGKLDYNGLLELECPECGFRYGAGAGCT